MTAPLLEGERNMSTHELLTHPKVQAALDEAVSRTEVGIQVAAYLGDDFSIELASPPLFNPTEMYAYRQERPCPCAH